MSQLVPRVHGLIEVDSHVDVCHDLILSTTASITSARRATSGLRLNPCWTCPLRWEIQFSAPTRRAARSEVVTFGGGIGGPSSIFLTVMWRSATCLANKARTSRGL